jgi:hypothetical protein
MATERAATLAPVSVIASGASVASTSNAISGTIDPTASAFGGTGTAPGYPSGRFVFSGTFSAGPIANSAIYVYVRLPVDGTLTGTPGAFETDLGRTTNPIRALTASIPLDSANTTQSRMSEVVDLPAVPFEVIVVNAATGATLNSGWTLTVEPTSRSIA